MGHKTGSRANSKKICRQKLRSEERITCAKFQKNWSNNSTIFLLEFAGTGGNLFYNIIPYY